MAFQYYDLEVRSMLKGFPVANTFRLKIEDPSVANEFLVAQSIINALTVGAGPTAWMFRYRALMSEYAYVSNILCRRASNGGGNTAEANLEEADLPGLATGSIAASQVAGCMIWLNDDLPHRTGRTFVPFVTVDDMDDGRFSASYQERAEDFIARHVAGFAVSAGTAFFCTFDSEFNVGYQILNGYLSPKVGTQRRREKPL